jgi:HAMP domain-containing protein
MLLRINLALIAALALAAVFISTALTSTLRANATRQVLAQAALMMDGASAVRNYTATEILPLVDTGGSEFHPQTVPFYAATQNFLQIHRQHPDYSYKEATLNPTNPRDRATDWEADIVRKFRDDATVREISGERETAMGRELYLARPIPVGAACLTCHSVPAAAPAGLVARYGGNNGFGWQLNEIVGAQILSVPMSSAIAGANRAMLEVMWALAAMNAAILLIVNAALYVLVVRPVRQFVRIADQVSVGDTSAPQFPSGGGREIAQIRDSFNRMRKSLAKALQMIGK